MTIDAVSDGELSTKIYILGLSVDFLPMTGNREPADFLFTLTFTRVKHASRLESLMREIKAVVLL